ncbi:hypothetical protein SESBI_32979 [Sesbania bispinosa]|nr:hypothetical protein SESBI_32979 [Sesbania bispinosa]
MAQQQPRREEFQNHTEDVRTEDVRDRDRDRDVNKNDEFGTRTATDPVAPYAYGTMGNVGLGYGGAAGGDATGAYGGMGDANVTTEYRYTAVYGTTGMPPGYAANTGATTGYGTAGVGVDAGGGQWGQEANTTGSGDTGRNRNKGGRDQ